MTGYEGIIVRKPWGYEYLMYQNASIGVWYLHIRYGAQTSLHCHPKKKTGYILLSGECLVSFLNDSVKLKALSKMMIREGLFHSTKAVSPRGINIIEVENPPDKENLVRLEDEYGRKEMPYEGEEALAPMKESCLTFADPEAGRQVIHEIDGACLVLEKFEEVLPLKTRPSDEIILVLDDGLLSKTGECIVSPGDVVTIGTFNRLAETFAAPSGVSLMTVRKSADGVNAAG